MPDDWYARPGVEVLGCPDPLIPAPNPPEPDPDLRVKLFSSLSVLQGHGQRGQHFPSTMFTALSFLTVTLPQSSDVWLPARAGVRDEEKVPPARPQEQRDYRIHLTD